MTTEHLLLAEMDQQRGAGRLDGLRFIFEKMLARSIGVQLVGGESEGLYRCRNGCFWPVAQ